MKGFLVSEKRDYPKSHDLLLLHRLMRVDWLDEHLVTLKKMSLFYIPIRYPDAMAGSLPEGLPGEETAREILNEAEKIVAEIQKRI